MVKLAEGWGWPWSSRKAHYFEEAAAISVCNKWMFSGERDPDSDTRSADDCTACRRWLDRARVAE